VLDAAGRSAGALGEFPPNSPEANLRTIVITGCSTGFGRVTAFYLAERGWRVLATVRQETQRAELLAEATTKGLQDWLSPLLCDITVPADVQRLAQQVAEHGVGLDALLNNAGTNYPGPLELVTLEYVRAQLDINLFAHLAVTQALLPALKKARGTVMYVSAQGARMGLPLNGPYDMSKLALEAMSDVLRVELAHFGVKVVIVVPGASPTPIWETSLRRSHDGAAPLNIGDYVSLAAAMERWARQTAASGFPPEVFARTVRRIVDSPRPAAVYYVPRSAALIVALRRLMPEGLWDWGLRRWLRW
jgi:NAD(P)-dependent dehydrogenase (short-subunit alcohol dehydrogenase family)